MPRTDAVADSRQANGGIALAVPPPEALDSEARFLPDGSIDWLWYYEQQDILEAALYINDPLHKKRHSQEWSAQ